MCVIEEGLLRSGFCGDAPVGRDIDDHGDLAIALVVGLQETEVVELLQVLHATVSHLI